MILAMSVGETLTTGGITAGLGISITFIVLAVLILIVSLVTKMEKVDFKKIFSKLKKKSTQPIEIEAEQVSQNEELTDDKKLVAAITAAISVVLTAENAENGPKAAFKVKSIKRI